MENGVWYQDDCTAYGRFNYVRLELLMFKITAELTRKLLQNIVIFLQWTGIAKFGITEFPDLSCVAVLG
jgi:hypothetical protein